MNDALNTPYNRMAFRKAATHFGVSHGMSHHNKSLIRETIYTLAAVAPFAIGAAIKGT
jgi:hypothetical protein